MSDLAVATGACFLITVLLGPLLIPVLRRLKFGQYIRDEGPTSHRQKAGTPTMGGLLFLVASLLVLLILEPKQPSVWAFIVALIGYGLLGFSDDLIKTLHHRSLGLTPRQKMAGQVVLAVGLFIYLKFHGLDTQITIPVIHVSVQLGWWYLLFMLLLLTASSNAVNLTDGLDGLAAGICAIAFLAYGTIAYTQSNFPLAIAATTMVGATLGFLVWNVHPARVFMGDTGSLALGGALGMLAILTKQELLLIIVALVPLIETLSVIIQVSVYKRTRRRVFRMTPLHHHFELIGYSEWQVVLLFWLAGVAFGTLGLWLWSL
ncbi:MAG: phospho-N-acetylmuramoyl-pentapeptide-transferase [Firmicutes bacterium]|nr:phospho-N-acetylmuramoyl-pentapeptide-transferase [Bacillota bacterium]